MALTDEIYQMAAVFAPAGTDEQMLFSLCRAAEQSITARLRPGVTADDCRDSFVCAAAWIAVSYLPQSVQTRQVQSFTVGEVSVTAGSPDADVSGAAACLRTQAELLMAPYCASGGGFAFLGVRG